MPTYQYACTECGHAFDQVQSFADDTLTECPACHGRLRKVYNAVGVVFKGSGFYRNDSRATTSSSDSPAASGDSSSDKNGTKSDSKGGTKTETKSDSSGSKKSESSSSTSTPAAAS